MGLDLIFQFEPYNFSIGFILGLITGLFVAILNYKHGSNTQSIVSLIIVFSWLIMHVVGFVVDRNVSWLFDVVGAGAVGNLIGLDIIQTLKNARRK